MRSTTSSKPFERPKSPYVLELPKTIKHISASNDREQSQKERAEDVTRRHAGAERDETDVCLLVGLGCGSASDSDSNLLSPSVVEMFQEWHNQFDYSCHEDQ